MSIPLKSGGLSVSRGGDIKVASAADIARFIANADARAFRAAEVTAHNLGDASGSEGGFSGFSASDLSGATVRTVANAAALLSQLQTDAGSAQTTIIECDWDGSSTFTPANVNGPAQSNLTANGSVDYGFNRYGSKILVRPATGRTPTIAVTTSTRWLFTGMEWLEFRDVTLSKICLTFGISAGFFPSPAILAFTRCTIEEVDKNTGNLSFAAMRANNPIRTLHVEDCSFSRNFACWIGAAQYTRFFNNTYVNCGPDDFIGDRGYSGSYAPNWTTHFWAAGNALYAGDSAYDPGSSAHADFLQYDGAQYPAQKKLLVEFNYVHPNRIDTEIGSQGFVGFENTAGGIYSGLTHNNAFLIGAVEAVLAYDPEDGGEHWVLNNHVLRQGNGSGDSGSSTWLDYQPRIRSKRDTTVTRLNTGTCVIDRNVSASISLSTTQEVTTVTRTNDLICDPGKAANTANDADAYKNRFAGSDGSGAGFVTNTHSDSEVTYSLGETASDTKADVLAGFRSFFKLQGANWPTNAADGEGCVDPLIWPARPWELT